MTTSNLALPTVTANQNNKEVTINDGINGLDNATQGLMTVSMASGSVTLTETEFKSAFVFRLTSASSPQNLTVPDLRHGFIVDNQSGFTVTVKRATGTSQPVENNQKRVLYNDLTNIISIGGSDVQRFTDLLDTESAYTGSAGKVVKVKPDETGLEFADEAGGGGSGGSNYLAPFIGCRVERTNAVFDVTAPYYFPWDFEQFDSGAFHSTVTDNDQVKVPSVNDYTKMQVKAAVKLVDLTAGTDLVLQLVDRDGSEVAYDEVRVENTGTEAVIHLDSGIIRVVDTNPYAFAVKLVSHTGSTDVTWDDTFSFLSLEILETTSAEGPPYDVAVSVQGEPTDGLIIMDMIFTRDVTFPADFVGSKARAGVNATATAEIDILAISNGSGSAGGGTITFAAGNPVGTFSGAGVNMFAGGVLRMTCPATADLTLADITITLAGFRGVGA